MAGDVQLTQQLSEDEVADPAVHELVQRVRDLGGTVLLEELTQQARQAGGRQREIMETFDRAVAYGIIGARNFLEEVYIVEE
jgi:hypothetical protein